MSFVQLPRAPLVTTSEIDRLRQKFLETQATADYQRFWLAIQRSKQPVIEDQPDYGDLELWKPIG